MVQSTLHPLKVPEKTEELYEGISSMILILSTPHEPHTAGRPFALMSIPYFADTWAR